jgi:membrane protease YdiL (CAAX protease family)
MADDASITSGPNSEPPPDSAAPGGEAVQPPAPDGPAEIPVVLPALDPPPAPRKPQPGFGWSILWTLGFAAVLFGVMIGIVLVAAVVLSARGVSLQPAPGAGPSAVPPALADVLAVSIPVAYLAALLFTILALRLVAGRGWPRQIGLHRLPCTHLLLVLVALPGFMIVSDGIARLLMELFGSSEVSGQEQMLKELFTTFPAWFAVLAIGIGPGVVEELWCRGFLGRGLVGRYGWPVGILLASLFFGLLHMYPLGYVLVTAVMGVGLHLVYLASRSLWVPMVLHTLNNSLAVLLTVGTIPSGRLEQNLAAAPVLIPLLGVVVLFFVGVAMATGRVRLAAADPSLPAWEPPYPGVAEPPPGANAVLRTGRPSPAATVLAVVASGILVYLLCR